MRVWFLSPPAALLATLLAGTAAHAQVGSLIQVTTTADTVTADGACSLREAIIAANTNSVADGSTTGCQGTGTDSIRFALGSGTPHIGVLSALPTVSAPVSIRGNTGGATRVELSGPGPGGAAFAGLTVTTSGVTLRSLVINNFNGAGVVLNQASGTTLTGSLIGTAADGISAQANTGAGVQITGSAAASNHVIGGTGAGEANVIAFNGGAGVSVNAATGNSLRANSIHDNAGGGIVLTANGNQSLAAPKVTAADTTVTGTSTCLGCAVDVYVDGWNQGEAWLGATTTAPADGAWTLAVAPATNYVTATVTNGAGSTSPFALPRRCTDTDADGLCDGVDDSDLDTVVDGLDNCLAVANAGQCDSDFDGYGNHCDGDLNNNGFTNAFDTPLFRVQLGQSSVAPNYNAADLNCNGFVNAFDTPLFRALLGKPPGPSGLHRPPTCSPGLAGCGWQVGDMFTMGQADWDVSSVLNSFSTVYGPAGVEVGIAGTAGYSMTFTSSSRVRDYLPTFGTPDALTADLLNPTVSSSGNLGGEVLALQLNVDFDDAGLLPKNANIRFGDLHVCGYSVSALNRQSVDQILDLADRTLGGEATGYTPSTLWSLAILLNTSFGLGGVSTFAQEHVFNGPCP